MNEVEYDSDDYVDDVTEDESHSDHVDMENGSSVLTAAAVTKPITKASVETSQHIPKRKENDGLIRRDVDKAVKNLTHSNQQSVRD